MSSASLETSALPGGSKDAVHADRDDDDGVDQEQLDDYREMLEKLGSFPDKVAINSLSMVAEDHADSLASARAIYGVIRERLLSAPRDNLLPLVYVVDSILKNVRGKYIDLVQADARDWLPTVYHQLPPPLQEKLHKVFVTWQEARLFAPEALAAMGRCFDGRRGGGGPANGTGGSAGAGHPLAAARVVAGMPRAADGTLLLPGALRRAMQAVLDELQGDSTDELEKVSLERLADLNPDLLASIKATAQDNLVGDGTGTPSAGPGSGPSDDRPAFLRHDPRPPTAVRLEQEWAQLTWDADDAVGVVERLRYQPSSEAEILYTQQEARSMTAYFATAQALAGLLQTGLERVRQQAASGGDSVQGAGHTGSGYYLPYPSNPQQQHLPCVSVDRSSFTNEGIKRKNDFIIGYLYQMGLPFCSSSDGRRFATQLELSRHLDALFKRNQLEKTMTRTEERGWTVADAIWMRQDTASIHDEDVPTAAVPVDSSASLLPGYPDDAFPADDARDRCVVCGINFQMFFDNDQGAYMYKNCREVPIENDEAAEDETTLELVHVTCWKALGSPALLTRDQALLEASRFA